MKALVEVAVSLVFIPFIIWFGSVGAALAFKPRGNSYVDRFPMFRNTIARSKDSPVVNGLTRLWGLAVAILSPFAVYTIGKGLVRIVGRM